MTSTTPKNQTAYFDVELPLTVDQLSAAGNLSSSFPAPFHLDCSLQYEEPIPIVAKKMVLVFTQSFMQWQKWKHS